MFRHKLLLSLLIATMAAMTGCGGSSGDGDKVNVTIIEDDDSNNDSGGDSGQNGSCANFVDTSFASCADSQGSAVGTLQGTIDNDYTLTSEVEWRLDGTVAVGDGNRTLSSASDVQAVKDAGVTLTIEAGTDIRAFDDGSLLVTRGSQLMAEGTASNPITFSSLDADYDGLGEWGGVIVQGFASQYGQGGTGACFGSGSICNIEGEGGTEISVYGGNEDDDNSGVIRYVRIAEGGKVAGPNNEINGLTLQGVGHGTTIEYVQVHNNLDDGVEWFGGTVNAKYLVLTGNDDDDIDYDEGYRGNVQYAIIQKDPNKATPTGSNDPRGIEANSSDDDYVPETEAVLANITLIGGAVNNADGAQQPGMRLRGAVTTTVVNSAVQGFDTGCIRIDDADTDGSGSTDVNSNVTLENVIGDCQDGYYDKRAADTVAGVGVGANTTFSVGATYAINESIAQLSSSTTINAVNNGSSFVFDQTDYIGAVDPTAASGWWESWTIPGSLASANPDSSPSFVSCTDSDSVCTLSGSINQDYTLVSGVDWRIDGEVIVGNGNVSVANDTEVQSIKDAGVTLTIKPGVHVRAFDDGSLLVTRGSKLEAVGTVASPITFSSLSDSDFDGEGEWGGVIVQGFAPQYGQGGSGACFGTGTVCNVEGEGGTVIGRFGGNDVADNSGTIRYVRIAEGGKVAGPNNEINGLTLQGVGYGTTIEYVQVHNNLDDGVEWFGGTVNAKYLVLTGNDDDDIDFDEGYVGNIQYAIVRKNPTKGSPTGSNDPRGIEANSSDDEYAPETNAVLANILLIGSDVSDGQPGMRLRGALTTSIYNTAVMDFDTGKCIRVDDADVDGDDVIDFTSDVSLINVLGDCVDGYYAKRAADTEVNAVAVTPLTLDAAYALTNAEASVSAPSISAVGASGFSFDQTDYVGAVEPGTSASNAWWSGWIIEGSLD